MAGSDPAVVFFGGSIDFATLGNTVWQVRPSQKFMQQTEQVLSGLTLSNTWVRRDRYGGVISLLKSLPLIIKTFAEQ